ncbi:hypothetical protein [Jiella sonneratiae]|uniref:Uncharacterized protein n=1 Tax=Jiella sonneratiae TaxID=2816856 RepID=A0ABS3IY45_9HYPH|nr:hypothetical protein [Jiella sonneratiae]MBO0902322.1 hypothetical protein [Jiella sonneratiae]
MSEPDTVASHTLEYLRRLDRRQSEFSGLLLRQQQLIGRLERTMREGLVSVQRDLSEIKGDIALLENRILNRLNVEMELSDRLGRLERRETTDADEMAHTPKE